MQAEIRELQFNVPINEIYPLMKAVKDLGIDISIDKEIHEHDGSRWREATILCSGSTLFTLGILTGISMIQNKMTYPLEELEKMLGNILNKIDNK